MSGNQANAILGFDPDQRIWITRQETLRKGRGYHYAALVDDNIVDC